MGGIMATTVGTTDIMAGTMGMGDVTDTMVVGTTAAGMGITVTATAIRTLAATAAASL